MCGIFGIISNENDIDSSCIQHRGPDNTTTKKYSNISFTFYRLSINDLSEQANQPFEDENSIWMCNGEIYNFKKLIHKYGIVCKSKSDCEPISQLYNTLGINSFCRVLDGVFAISLYDKNLNTLYLIRDMVGVRPIYYYYDADVFTFASEGKALNFVKNRENIRQLPPSSYLEYDMNNKSMSVRQYFDFDRIAIDNTIKVTDGCSKINELLTNSIRKRLISDRPIGCLLSGGLDSSLVASILSKLLKEQGKTLKTFRLDLRILRI